MIERLVKEINICLENKCYMSALTIAMTLPDICGKAEYPEMRTGDRYMKWYNNYVFNEDPFELHFPKELAYSLRCNLLHAGDPITDIDILKKSDSKKLKVEKFGLIIRENSNNNTMESSKSYEDGGITIYKYYDVNVLHLCKKIANSALKYYECNKEKFNFFKYRIINTADHYIEMFNLPEEMTKVEL